MARVEKKLSARAVAALREPGRHSDGGGLYLSIDPSGRRRWVFMYTRSGKRVELGLGGRDLSLADARDQAAELRSILARGGDPRSERQRQRTSATFGEMADTYIESMRPSWRNAKHAAQWTMTLTRYCAPIRGIRVDLMTTDDILRVLQPLWSRTPETAERLRGRIENVLDAARAKGLRSGENPARWRGHLDQLLPKRQRLTRGHHAAMPYSQLPAFLQQLQSRQSMVALALQFTILTAARSGEVLGAKWAEIDLDQCQWIVPKDRMKAGQEHRVPLCSRAIDVLLNAHPDLDPEQEHDPAAYLFWSKRPSKPLSSMAMAMQLRRLNVPYTVHGFRSTFRDWAAETSHFSHEVCEMALAHTIANKAEAAYRRGDLFEKRRALMNAWADYVSGTPTGLTGS